MSDQDNRLHPGGPSSTFDQLQIGHSWRTATRTISEADVTLFAGLTADHNQLHTSEHFCRESTQFGRRIAHGLLVLSAGHGLMFLAGITQMGIAFAGIEDWRFVAPCYLGDDIYVEVTVQEKRESRSKPDRGLVKFRVRIFNTGGDVLQEGTQILMMRRG